MRLPRASAVVVALSTFVAVAMVAALASQLAPLDRAGAILPDGPITTEGQPTDAGPSAETPTGGDDSAPESPGAAPEAGMGSTDDSTTVVVPAPAEIVQPDPEPSGPPESPGNSGNAPGQSGSPGNNGSTPGKP